MLPQLCFRPLRFLWTCPLLLAITASSPLVAQFPEPVRSVRVHGEMDAGGRTLNLSQATKGQDRIRASVQAPDGQTAVTIYFADNKIVLAENLPEKQSVRELTGSDAAGYLLDLLALNPEYHFRPVRGFDLAHPVFESFSLNIQRVEAPAVSRPSSAAEAPQLVKQIQLIDRSGGNETVIRTVRYLERFPEGAHGWNPQKIEFLDNTTGKIGIVTLKEYKYNAGLLDFIFEPPAAPEAQARTVQ